MMTLSVGAVVWLSMTSSPHLYLARQAGEQLYTVTVTVW